MLARASFLVAALSSFIAFMTLSALTPTSANAAPRELLQIATCGGAAAEYQGTLRHRVVLERQFLDGSVPDDEHVRRAVGQQLRYLWGYLRTSPIVDAAPAGATGASVGVGAARGKVALVLSAEEPELRILSRATAPYGRDLELDWKQTDPRLVIDDDYTLRAIRGGHTRASDPALVVEYEVRFKLALCGAPRPAESSIDVPLPEDPWLLYWHVAATNRRPMRYLDEPPAVTNPCSDDDFADLPHPFYYWYDWQPERHGLDDAGHPFDCRRWLHAGVDFAPRKIALTRSATPTPDFSDLRRELAAAPGPLRATVLIGVLDHFWKDLALSSLRRELGPGGASDLPSLAKRALDAATPRERATVFFLAFLRDLAELIDVASWKSQLDGRYLSVTVQGRLRRSGRAIELRAWIGDTDIFGLSPPEHWPILGRALATDHIVIYAGHSGLGENFRLARIEAGAHLSHADFSTTTARAPYQLLAFLSCYSYMYFGQDLLAAEAARGSSGGEMVYTGTAFTKGDRGALAILDRVDEQLATDGRHGVVGGQDGSSTLRYVAPEDFLIWKAITPAGKAR